MKRSVYHERDYTFGQAILSIRTRIGLTQAGLAQTLGVSRKAVIDWEGGINHPDVKHLKKVIALAIQHRAFPAGREIEEVHTLWKNAHQKVLIDETWLATLLTPSKSSPSMQHFKETLEQTTHAHRVDWDDAPVIPNFYGREREIQLLTNWVVSERCQVITVLGFGGVGKSALTVRLMHLLEEQFDVVIWRPLRNYSTCKGLIEEILQVLAPEAITNGETTLERSEANILSQMRKTRVLLVLDGLEAVLGEREDSGRMRTGFKSCEHFLDSTAETEHQSCVILTSREDLMFLAPLEGSQAKVRSYHLSPLDAGSCDKLLSEKNIIGNGTDRIRLIEAYDRNPLALKIAAHTIVDLFDGEIVPFLDEGEVIMGSVRDLFEEQFHRLSNLEQSLVLWLTILREPTTTDKLLEVWAAPFSRARILEALDSLYGRSLIKHGIHSHEFTLPSLFMEYLKTVPILQASGEGQEGELERLIEHGYLL